MYYTYKDKELAVGLLLAVEWCYYYTFKDKELAVGLLLAVEWCPLVDFSSFKDLFSMSSINFTLVFLPASAAYGGGEIG